jgi:hypothetical protein
MAEQIALAGVIINRRTAECAGGRPRDDEVAGVEERSTMTTVWRGLTRVVGALLALPEGYPAEGVDRSGPSERLELWGQEEPKLVRVPYWLRR